MPTTTKTVAKAAPKKSIIEKLTIGELAKVEEISGIRFAKASDDGFDMKTMQAFIYVILRRQPEHLNITFEEAGNYTFEDANKILDMGDDE